MKILVTGAAGFIGTHLTRELELAGHHVVGVDRDDYDLRYQTPPLEGYDVCVHLAALAGRLFGELDPYLTVCENAGVTSRLAAACGQAGVRMMYTSTSEAYGDHHGVKVGEEEPMTTLPYNLYGLSKLWGEDVCRLYAPDGLQIIRPCMPYGPGLPAGVGRAAIMTFMHNALHDLPLTVHRGTKRSWCWIDDTVRAVRMVLESGQPGVFNVGRDDDLRPMEEIAELACDIARKSRSLIQLVDPPDDVVAVKTISTQKIRDLGWRPLIELETGMRTTIQRMKVAVAA